MCTAISFKTKDHYFGRTIDMHFSYDSEIIITPRNFPFKFRDMGEIKTHFAIIGIGIVKDGYPLYFDAVNEKGLGVAGLNFAQNCVYNPISASGRNIAPFEVIPWLLSEFRSVDEVLKNLKDINIANVNFSKEIINTPLHWMISDKNRSITLEQTVDGLKVYDNKMGVLTNDPPFNFQVWNLNNYLNLTNKMPENRFSNEIELKPYSYGMGSIGLPGDNSSASRFVRAVYSKFNSVCGQSEKESVAQFFHILGTVTQIKGSAQVENGEYQTTLYSSCCNTQKGVYYYKTYENSCISVVDMNREDLEQIDLITYPMLKRQNEIYQN